MLACHMLLSIPPSHAMTGQRQDESDADISFEEQLMAFDEVVKAGKV